jgi:hypothetical protein
MDRTRPAGLRRPQRAGFALSTLGGSCAAYWPPVQGPATAGRLNLNGGLWHEVTVSG